MPYTPNPQHRNAAFAAKKTQWIVPLAIEQQCYTQAVQEDWLYKDCYWGIHWNDAFCKAEELGTAPAPIDDNVQIAKYVCDSHDNWHGYPVAHWGAPWDRPDTGVLRKWLANGFISATKMSKIIRGKKCTL
ncbi:hypothetical protein M1E08_04450 [Erwinia sp. PK3-005]